MSRRHWTTWASLALSLLGVALVAGFLAHPVAPSSTDMKMLVWSVFTSLCVLGAFATLFPHRCSPSISLSESLEPQRYTLFMGIRLVHGHHPACGHFRDHEIILRRKTFCAGCTGLLVGAVASIIFAILYFVYNFRLPAVSGYLGLGFVVLGLVFIPLVKTRPVFRSGINALFVLGFSLVLISVDRMGNLGFDLVVIGLCVYWIFTRIQLSRWSHDTVCGGCDEPCDEKMV